MTIAEKLRFLADRVEDEKEFYIGRLLYKYQNGELMVALDETEKDCKFTKRGHSLDFVLYLDFKLKPQWEFTEDEKVILRNLPDELQWIARDKSDNVIWIYNVKPIKVNQNWGVETGNPKNLRVFNHLFQSIQWSDDEPCEFRKYL